jgi:glycosyltransferase involved in cell wall biosynthesis
VVHQGVDHEVYQPQPKTACREYFGLDDDRTYVLIVSSNSPRKRIEDAPEVLEIVREQYEDATLLKAGYGTELSGDQVVSTGWIPEADMPKLYGAADVYLHTAEYEGFGLAVLEAMACGTPVVARDVASIPEIVGDVYELAPADAPVERLASDVTRRLAQSKGVDEEAVTRSDSFSWEQTAAETKAVYNEVLSGCNS